MQRRRFIQQSFLASAGIIMLPALKTFAGKQGLDEAFGASFLHPPDSARPWCFYMWMNGHITKHGITADLEAMKRMGIGGMICFNSAVGIPRGPVDYASEAWMDATAHTASEAQRFGLELALHNSPGYSGAGGPWITPAMSMQELVWTETRVTSAGKIDIDLSQPYKKLNYYRDAFVIAYPSLAIEQALMKDKLIMVSANGKEIDKTIITDGNPETKFRLAVIENVATMLFEFAEPFEARSITIQRKPETPHDLFDGPRDHPPVLKLEYSNNGTDFTSIGTIRLPELREMDTPGSLSFKAIKATYFRLVANSSSWISEVELHNGPRLAGWSGKTSNTHGDSTGDTPQLLANEIIESKNIIDISSFMDANGRLTWNAPAGNWTILRIGHTSTGEENAAHPDSGKGLELDKFRTAALDLHFEKFLDKVIHRLKPLAPQAFKAITIDSWEAGKQNWTIDFAQAFKQKTNYEITKWMPALTGRIVDSVEDTERFLWDTRSVQAQLLSDNFYGHYSKLCHERGLNLYAEPYGDGNFDSLQSAQHLDITMSEFWTRYIYGSDVTSKQAASAAHIYGKSIVAAESYTAMPATAKWTDYPYSLKAEGDYFFTLGVNRLTFHTFVHQPYNNAKPGMTMGPFGMHIDRNNTWTEQAYGWTDYIKRTQYLLQQGLFVADLCYFKGDDPTSGVPNIYTFLPEGYKGDVIGPDALHDRLSIKDGKIILPNGMSYTVCMMAPLQSIHPKSFERLKQLVNDGMTLIVNTKPSKALGHTYKDDDVQKIADELYGDLDGQSVQEKSYGKGKVIWKTSLKEAFNYLSIQQDFYYESLEPDTALHYVHKQTKDADYYFISNHRRRKENVICSFRINGKQPEIWDGESGRQFTTALWHEKDGRSFVSIALTPAGSVFVVFRKTSSNRNIKISELNYFIDVPDSDLNRPNVRETTSDFTITLWAKPDSFAHGGRSFLFHAPEGKVVYGAGHAAVAMNAGQNGVRVYERSNGSAKEVLFAQQSIRGWTHIALVYMDATPYVYLNGVLAVKGKKSAYIIHPGLGTPQAEEQYASYFEGNLTKPNLHKQVLLPEVLKGFVNDGLPAPKLPTGLDLRIYNGHVKALAFSNATYLLKGILKKPLLVKDCETNEITGPWKIEFPKSKNAPSGIFLNKLQSLHLNNNFNVKHFSGTATYIKEIVIQKNDIAPTKKLFLHLGRVEVIAEVFVNGKKAGILWKEPFMIDITQHLKVGTNKLEIAVTTLWPNRLIGDEHLPKENEYTKDNNLKTLPDWYVNEQPKPGDRTTFAVWHTLEKDSPLLEAGLLGPVVLLTAIEKEI